MRPVALTIEAFGPYRGTIHLDFTELSNHTMFLISGPTGAGKTSVLDAMVYALYGEPSGEDRKADSIRSDFAEPHTLTRVEFTFSIGDSVYRVERLPKQEVAKKRGVGTKVQGARAVVSQLRDDEWQVIATSAADVRETIQRIIGFRRDQFLQVVLLPQGEFRKLLVASTGEREELLHTLFHTDVYRSLQERLKEEFQAVQSGIEETLREQDVLLQSLNTGDDGAILTIEHVKEYLTLLEKERQGLEENRQRLTETADSYERMRRSAQAYDEAVAEEAQVLERISQLRTEGEALETLRARVSRLDTVSDAAALYNEWRRREDLSRSIRDDLAARQAHLTALQSNLETAKRDYDLLIQSSEEYEKKRRRFDLWREQGPQWEQLKELTEKNKALHKACDRMKSNLAATEKDILRREGQLRLTDKKLTAVDAFLTSRSDVPVTHRTLTEQLQLLKQCRTLYDRYAEAKDKETALRTELDMYKNEAASLKISTERLELLSRDGGAFVLALDLKDGEPCPVCGAVEHPNKAVKPELIPTPQELESARQALLEGERRVSKIEGQVALQTSAVTQRAEDLQQSCELLRESCCQTILTVDDFEHQAFQIERELQEQFMLIERCVQAVESAQRWRQKLSVLRRNQEEEITGGREELTAAKAELHGKELEISNAEGQLTRLKSVITVELPSDWQAQITMLQADIEAFDTRLATATADIDKAGAQVLGETAQIKVVDEQLRTALEGAKEQQENFQQSLRDASCDESEFQVLLNEFASLKEYRTTIQTFDARLNETQAVLKAVRQRLDGMTVPEKRIGDDEYELAVAARDEAVGRLAARDQQLQTARHVFSKLSALDRSVKEARSQYEFVRRLYELANGGAEGLKNLTFERYVLGLILDEVVYASNIRLQKMSRGRYSLERSDYTGAGRGKQGLDLAVMDSYTGQARPANTLSGGETFLASMALALGLADVIQSYAGGIHMDTIFIDEGFGTLDPDTLDLAMETLIQLQRSGRLIGLISHVPDLKSRIPAHLEIERSDAGSTAKFVVAGA